MVVSPTSNIVVLCNPGVPGDDRLRSFLREKPEEPDVGSDRVLREQGGESPWSGGRLELGS